MTRAEWDREVRAAGGVSGVSWPFDGVFKGQLAARFPSGKAPKGATVTKNKLWAYELAPVGIRLMEAVSNPIGRAVAAGLDDRAKLEEALKDLKPSKEWGLLDLLAGLLGVKKGTVVTVGVGALLLAVVFVFKRR